MSTYAVMGATGTIGSELCRQLVKDGHRTLLVARDLDKLHALAETLGPLSVPCHLQQLSQSEQLKQALEQPLGDEPWPGSLTASVRYC